MALLLIYKNIKLGLVNYFSKYSSMKTINILKKQNILVRITLLCWLVIVITIAVFVMTFIPYQTQLIIDNMQSMAKVMATSIEQITKQSIVEEDYSSLVDHCMKILNNNKSIIYLVITRKDGYSLIHLRNKWYHQNLDKLWRPDSNKLTKASSRKAISWGKRFFTIPTPSAIRALTGVGFISGSPLRDSTLMSNPSM